MSVIKKYFQYGWMENLKNEAMALHDNISAQKNSAEMYFVSAISVEQRRKHWTDMISNMNLVKTNYLTEFEQLWGTSIKDFFLGQLDALVELVKAVDIWLETYRHDGLYVYDKPLDATEVASLKTLIEGFLE